jgi:hypothetical protein
METLGPSTLREPGPGQSTLSRYWTLGFYAMALAMAACLVYGFYTERTLQQAIWAPLGIQHLVLLVDAYGLFAAACYRFARRSFVPLGAGLAAFLAVTSFGFGPVVGVAFYAVSALALGDALLSVLGVKRETAPILALAPIAFLAGMGVIVFAIGLAVHFPVNYPGLYVAGLSLPLVLNWKALRFYAGRLARCHVPVTRTPAAFAASVLLVFFLLIHFLAALNPEVGYDALVMHLTIPAYVESHHLWAFDVRSFIWAVTPMAGDWAFTGAYMVGGEYAARLTNFAFLAATVVLLYWFARRWLRRPVALLAVALFASTPLVQLITGSLFVENMQAAVLLAAAVSLERLRATRERAYLIVAGLLLGTAAATKLGSFGFILALALVAAIWPRTPGRPKLPLWPKLGAAAVFVLAAAPQYAYAFWVTANPTYPFLSGLFHSPGYPNIAFANPFSPKFHLATVLYRLTFHSHEYMESLDGSLGFHYLLLIPLSLLLLGRQWISRLGLVAAAAVAGSVSILYLQPNLRYLYPSLPLWSVLTFFTLAVAVRRIPGASRVLPAACAGVALLNAWFMPASGWWQKDLYEWSSRGRSAYEDYENAHAPVRKLVTYLNLRYPGEPVWFLGQPQIAGLRGRVYLSDWYQPLFEDEVSQCARPGDVAALLARHRLAHIVAPRDLEAGWAIPEPVKTFLRQSTETEMANGSYVLLRLKPPR